MLWKILQITSGPSWTILDSFFHRVSNTTSSSGRQLSVECSTGCNQCFAGHSLTREYRFRTGSPNDSGQAVTNLPKIVIVY